jgi:excisionase family DNA binding protein
MTETTPTLTAQQAADRLSVSLRQFERYVAAGKITAHRRVPGGRRLFVPAEVDAILEPDPRS